MSRAFELMDWHVSELRALLARLEPGTDAYARIKSQLEKAEGHVKSLHAESPE